MPAPSKGYGYIPPTPTNPGEPYLRVSVKYAATRDPAYYTTGSRMRWRWRVVEITPQYRQHSLDIDREDSRTLATGTSRIKFFALWRAKRAARLIDGEITFQTGGSVEARIARLEKELSIGS